MFYCRFPGLVSIIGSFSSLAGEYTGNFLIKSTLVKEAFLSVEYKNGLALSSSLNLLPTIINISSIPANHSTNDVSSGIAMARGFTLVARWTLWLGLIPF
jgi:hypothetical protein